jgi:peptidoglycan hydrolase-like protein with peptidoglycan-binding domain
MNALLMATIMLLLVGCFAPGSYDGQSYEEFRRGQQTGMGRPAVDRFLSRGDIHVAQEHLRAFGFDSGPVEEVFTAEPQAAVRAYQSRYGLPVTGLLDYATRRELLPGFEPQPKP